MITYNQRRIQGPLGEAPIVVSCGLGTDSIALLVELHKRAIRPNLILFANAGNEQNHTYGYIPILQNWLAELKLAFLNLTSFTTSRDDSNIIPTALCLAIAFPIAPYLPSLSTTAKSIV